MSLHLLRITRAQLLMYTLINYDSELEKHEFLSKLKKTHCWMEKLYLDLGSRYMDAKKCKNP